jgi:flagellin-like hook-associated protein FlgL
MRITQNILISNFLHNLDLISARIAKTEQQLASGKKFSLPSDGPVEISQIMGFQGATSRITQYMKNVDNGNSYVSYMDNILQSINQDVVQAHDLAITTSSDSLNTDDRTATALQFDLLLQSTLSNSNTRFQDRFSFAGWKNETSPFNAVYDDRTGQIEDVIFKGDKGVIDRLVGENDQLSVNVSGKDLFMEQTYTRQSKILPPNIPLGFHGTITINGEDFKITTNQSLNDISVMLNAASPKTTVFSSISQGSLNLESAKAVGKFVITDDRGGQLLQDLGLYLGGAFNTGTVVPSLPIVDSTPAVFTGAGPVANLAYNNTNNTLNIFLGAPANYGSSKAANITITPKTYASVADLIVEIQNQVDKAFGANRLVVSDAGGGTLQFATVATGNDLGAGQLVIGGTYFGIPDTASDSADLNLVAVAGNAPPTNAQVVGVNGNDKFIIDLGPTASKTGKDVLPQTIDLRGSVITTVQDLLDEIKHQIFSNDNLRGAVDVSLVNGKLHFETVKKGKDVLTSDFAFSEGATGTLTALGIIDVPTQAQILGSPLAFPFLVVAGFNDSITFDLGPSVSSDGTDPEPITLTMAAGIYNNINSVYNELTSKIQGVSTLSNSIQLQIKGPVGFEYLTVSSIATGSGVRGEDLNITGSLLGVLGLPPGNASVGGGTSDGQGIELQPENIFNTLINLRADSYGNAGEFTDLLSVQNAAGQLIDLVDGDLITVKFDGNTYTFTVDPTEKISNFVSDLQEIFGSRALVSIASDGRIRISNLETNAILDFSIQAKSALGISRPIFSGIFDTMAGSIPGLISTTSNQMLDPIRYQRLGEQDLAQSDADQQNVLQHLSIIGARANRLTTITNLFSSSKQNITDLRQTVEGSNYAEMVTLLSQQQLILQSSLAVGAKVLPPSLLDFL